MFEAGLMLDGVTSYRNFSQTFPGDNGIFRVYDDPVVYDFVSDGLQTVNDDQSYVIIQVTFYSFLEGHQ